MVPVQHGDTSPQFQASHLIYHSFLVHNNYFDNVTSIRKSVYFIPFIFQISLIGPGNIDTANLLVQLNYAKYSQESSILSDDCGSDDVDVIILSTFELNSEAEDINSETIMKEESNNYIKLSCNQEKEIKFNVTHNSKPHKNSFSDDSDDEIKKLFKENEKYVDVSEQEIVTKGEKSEEYEKSEIISDDDTGSVQVGIILFYRSPFLHLVRVLLLQ